LSSQRSAIAYFPVLSFGDLDEQAAALAHPDRPRQQFRADDADVAPLRAARTR
jgi:hypothetical protein